MDDWREAIDSTIDASAETLRAIRRHLHAHPEPSLEEFETTRYLARLLEDAGIPYWLIPSGRGIVAEPAAVGPAGRVAIRGDIDALRIQDAKTVPYRSTRAGVMHACGHDAHATMVLGAALGLWKCRQAHPWPTAWRALFQPAEEVGDGAREMVAAGAVEGVRAIVALHVDPERAVGRVAERSGALTAFCEDLEVTIQGRGGHAARPHQTDDPIAVAAQLVSSIYQFIPRSVDAREPVVVSFGSIQGGTSHNVIPERVRLLGTIRTLSKDTAARTRDRIGQISHALSEASGAAIEIAFTNGVDGVLNDPGITRVCAGAAAEVVGRDHVDTVELPSMGGEDFAAYLTHVPGCMLRLGVASAGSPDARHHLHTPAFDIDERSLTIGAKVLAHSVVLLAQRQE
jgi:amidohydrolase